MSKYIIIGNGKLLTKSQWKLTSPVPASSLKKAASLYRSSSMALWNVKETHNNTLDETKEVTTNKSKGMQRESRKSKGVKTGTLRWDMAVPTVSLVATVAMATLSVAASS